MTSRVIKVVECDRCLKHRDAPQVVTLPSGWGKLLREGIELHLCADCFEITLREVRGAS